MKLCAFVLCVLVSSWAGAQTQEQQKLAQLQAELKARQATLAANKANAEELQDALKTSEVEIGKVAKLLNNTTSSLADNRTEQAALKKEQGSLKEAILQQQSLLAGQLRSAFMAGNYDYAKMLFYQDEASSFERVITYYQYLSKARVKAINEFKDNVARLEEVTAQLAEKAQALSELVAEQKQQRNILLTRQKDREQTLKKLNQKIASDAAKVSTLKQNEEALVRAIEEAKKRAAAAKTVLAGLAGYKGKLLKPANGRVRKLFGSRRQGQVKWKGIIIEGAEGSAVRAVSHGRVLYSDWLRGFGLVTIIDHGKGYMSVYGHNQALLKQAGDTVADGETIALVGQSGGQSNPNLYFEIRHKGKALNPSQWLDI
ncbi:peptidoglycan DD-metalloendopeptidase family protein [Alteromonas sp. C1M14]|uniref:murein hydrolase activator EnvC family protein n=1 Tax=Alteromonas sp. C1M14 TaxID=2841567 RepID=UPI002090E5C7|nr:peptidoglycan DD-metalloendopeptidase family protein [Alteromonas sp. C1M14]